MAKQNRIEPYKHDSLETMSKSIERAYQLFRGITWNRINQYDRNDKVFTQFGMLSEDIIVEILSFVSYGPLELPNSEYYVIYLVPSMRDI